MTKVIVQTYPTLGNEREMEEHRPIGRSTAAFQRLLDGLTDLSIAADHLGYWGISHTEHHFHSEGIELSPNPGLYNLWAGVKTRHLHHGQLGYVLPTHDPIRLAEETAMIDQMLRGRFFVGMARGYQTRWCDVLGQRADVGPSNHGDEDRDNRNWAIFREHYRILKAAWTRDLVKYQGEHYRIPGQVDAPWPPAEEVTARYGAPGEIGPTGAVTGVAVVPRPYQQPHPPLFQAHSISPRTIGWCARENVVPIIQFPSMEACHSLAAYYQREAGAVGRNLALGENLGVIRIFHIAGSRDAALEMSNRYDSLIWNTWYRQFRYLELFRKKNETGPVPGPGETIAERLHESGMAMCGTVDDVKRGVERLLTAVPVEYLVWHLAWRPMPTAHAIEQLELFAEHIMPEFGLRYSAREEPPVLLPG